MASLPNPGLDIARLPDAATRRRTNVLVVSSVALAFISFWRAAAIVLCDLASTAYYIGGISEQAIGKAAPWFILGVMLFSYAVRAVYVESCTMFTRGGVYRVVKEAMGGSLAKLSVSALMFDYILTGPISAVSAGQYIVGLILKLWWQWVFRQDFDAEQHKQLVNLLAMTFAILATVYFWRANIIGIHESSTKALRIMQLTTVMGVLVIGWSVVTLIIRPELRHLPPAAPVFTGESMGWLGSWPKLVGALGIVIAFGHSLLAMSGEESLAQVNRELESPKTKNLLRTGFVIFLYSLLLTGLISVFAVMIIPDQERIATFVQHSDGTKVDVDYVHARLAAAGGKELVGVIGGKGAVVLGAGDEVVRQSGKYTDNLISGLANHVVGPNWAKTILQAFVVFVGFLILAGAVNTSMVGSNGVLNRLAEDGVLTDWFLHPQRRYGTTHRLINMVALLQLATIVLSWGDVYALGEAYAFGVIWSFVFKTLAMVVLRFKDKSPREYEVPGNIRIRRKDGVRLDLPIGIGLIFLILLGTAIVNLWTKRVATIWGAIFTAGFLTVFVTCEIISRRKRRGAEHEHLEQFNEQTSDAVTPEALGITHASPIVVAVRNPNSLAALQRILEQTDTEQRDVVVVTCKVLPQLTEGVTHRETSVDDGDRELLTKVVTVSEEVGKPVHPVVIPTNNPLYAIAQTACRLNAREVVLGVSEKMHADVQLEQFALAYGMANAERRGEEAKIAVRIVGPQVEIREVVD